ncbi:pectate lyase-like [Panicum miliaceum]|uniref:Pectate lyase n=1 Tax=Panicum miliaceum TaxID=4540 RepID=A0A3L6SUL3_PANMI|nr:pectate lyase-like [Panicum miliaceum]
MLGDDCGTGNPVDDCWRCDPSWADNRQRLADCAIGFGRDAAGGKNGKTYVVTDPSDDDPAAPAPGTLRYGLVQEEPLWITFARDMTIRPKGELVVSSHKTVDGRGADVVVGDGGACFVLHNVCNVIIHGLAVRGCKPARTPLASSSSLSAGGGLSDGDGITVFRSTDVWVDHCTLEACTDGLIDVTDASTRVTLSNNLMRNHDKAMLLGHSDDFPDDKDMKVTVAFNRFGPGLVQRMPRCRFGLFHVINNDYINWQIYAIGGSASPTILSHGNRFLADKNKEVTKRDGAPESEWSTWTWISEGDMMLNGACFRSSGSPKPDVNTPSFAKSVSSVSSMTASAGVLSCKEGSLC